MDPGIEPYKLLDVDNNRLNQPCYCYKFKMYKVLYIFKLIAKTFKTQIL